MIMETSIPGLYASPSEPLPFGRSLDIRAFLLQRAHGNLLLYSVTGLASSAAAIDALGGIARHYLNHWHEAAFASSWVEAPVFVHVCEREAVAETHRVHATFSTGHMLDDDFEIIPTPGHTSGATAYLWKSCGLRCLFPGDSIYLNDGDWVAAVLGSSDRKAYIESLEHIRQTDFDVIVPWAATRGQPYYAVTSRADAQCRIDAILERVRHGEDH
jgi:glyoxylase-like metal-dependent hydrolase (beta-lactamase superfamily II)